MEGYVSKSEIQKLKQSFDCILTKVRRKAKDEGITFTCNLVGSAKRNLVVRHPTKGIDCDYQLVIQSNCNDFNAEEIKYLFRHLFDKYKPQDFSYCEDSTSALTMKKKDIQQSKIVYSFDIVIMRNCNGIPEIIKRNNKGKYIWNQLQHMSDFQERFSKINGVEMWTELRKRYYKKKINKMNGRDNKKSFQLLNEAVNETLTVFK